VGRQTGGGATKEPLCAATELQQRNSGVLQQNWHSKMEERKMIVAHAKKTNSGTISFQP